MSKDPAVIGTNRSTNPWPRSECLDEFDHALTVIISAISYFHISDIYIFQPENMVSMIEKKWLRVDTT